MRKRLKNTVQITNNQHNNHYHTFLTLSQLATGIGYHLFPI